MQLRDYQIETIKKFDEIEGNVLLHGDMRIGKSAITSSYYKSSKYQSAIFVMPVSPMYQFKDDAIKFGVNPVNIVILNEWKAEDRVEELMSSLSLGKMVIVSHKIMSNLMYSNEAEVVKALKLKETLLIIDEADEIGFKNESKNRKSKTNMARAYRKIIKNCAKTIMMSGTVLQANSHEYIYYYYALNRSDRRSARPTIEEYFNIGMDRNGREEVRAPKNDQVYMDFLKTFMIRVQLKDVVDYIPDYTIEKIEVPDPVLLPHVQELRKTYLLPSKDVAKRYVKTDMDLGRKCMRLAVFPREYGIDLVSSKEEKLLEILKQNSEKNVIIFSVNKEFITYFGNKYEIDYIVGDVKAKDRAKFVNDFQSGTGQRIIINIASGAHGLTLDTADLMVFVDLPYSMTKFKQALARLIPRADHMVKDQRILILHNGLVDYRVEEILKEKEDNTRLGYEWKE